MDRQTTITVNDSLGIKPGDKISITSLDHRWWKKLWYSITFREQPTIITTSTVIGSSHTTLTIHDGILDA